MTDPTKTGRLDASVTIATVCRLRVNTHAVHARAATYSPSPNRDKPWPMARSQKLRLESRELSFMDMSTSSPHSLAAHRPQCWFLRRWWRNDIASPTEEHVSLVLSGSCMPLRDQILSLTRLYTGLLRGVCPLLSRLCVMVFLTSCS